MIFYGGMIWHIYSGSQRCRIYRTHTHTQDNQQLIELF